MPKKSRPTIWFSKRILIYLILLLNIVPKELAKIERIKNTVVNPNTNPTEFSIAFLLFLLSYPIKYDI